jgi:Fe-S-cluster containining protein
MKNEKLESTANISEKYLTDIIEKEEEQDTPCSKCNGDCCGAVPFKFSELERIFKKYSKVQEFKKRFKANPKDGVSRKLIKIQKLFGDGPEDGGLIVSFQKKVEYLKNGIDPGSCIFKRDEKIGSDHCMIYEDRPLICRAYGRKSCACPYAGLKEQPTGFIKEKLVNNSHIFRKQAMVNNLIMKSKEFKK